MDQQVALLSVEGTFGLPQSSCFFGSFCAFEGVLEELDGVAVGEERTDPVGGDACLCEHFLELGEVMLEVLFNLNQGDFAASRKILLELLGVEEGRVAE